ncbi:MAG TPA: hypothetical protein VH165_19945 [Kofleriaceae bacterium]|jgi:hypothetical protein|nr:hypothetical protein [Kofleriaceae bacterium]
MANLIDVLAAVDDRPVSESGAFVVDGDAAGAVLGSVFVETSQVCWAAAAGRGGRLRELLRRHAERMLSDAELDDVFVRCRDEQRALCDMLEERALVSGLGLRAALKQHTVESLIAQCDGAREVTWVPHRQRGYRARFTFPPIELLAATGAELYPREAAGASHGLELALPAARTAGSFALGDDDEAVAVQVAGTVVAPVRDLLELGNWAAAALTACNGFSPTVLARAVATASGPSALGWRAGRRLVHVAVIDDPAALSGVVAELGHRGLPAVVSSRLAALQLPSERSIRSSNPSSVSSSNPSSNL